MELNDCEHCESLGIRQRRAEVVYCEDCQPKVADLPVPKKPPVRVILPLKPYTALEDYEYEIEKNDDSEGFEAPAGGAE